jgi:hypothetical protein
MCETHGKCEAILVPAKIRQPPLHTEHQAVDGITGAEETTELEGKIYRSGSAVTASYESADAGHARDILPAINNSKG